MTDPAMMAITLSIHYEECLFGNCNSRDLLDMVSSDNISNTSLLFSVRQLKLSLTLQYIPLHNHSPTDLRPLNGYHETQGNNRTRLTGKGKYFVYGLVCRTFHFCPTPQLFLVTHTDRKSIPLSKAPN
eukprot:scaffold954_cov173-Ochromonas_danica.AAC.15